MNKKYKISLIMATLGREREVRNFIQSLLMQNYKNYELIIVDQNDEDFIKKISEEYIDKIKIIYVHSEKKGLSLSRNLGLKCASGDIIAFPDDDCEYSQGMLEDIINKFENEDIDIVTFKSIDKISKADSNNKWESTVQEVNIFNLFKTSISYTIFIKTKNIKDIYFDEKLGVGAYFGSAEESDMLASLLCKSYKGKYYPSIFAYHPIKMELNDRYFKYALGLGAFVKKELFYRKDYKYFFKGIQYIFIRPIGGLIVSLLKFRIESVKRYKGVFAGRFLGFIKYQ